MTYNNESILELAGPANTINDQIKDIPKSKNNEKLGANEVQNIIKYGAQLPIYFVNGYIYLNQYLRC